MLVDKQVFKLQNEPGSIRLEVVDLGERKDFALINGLTILTMNEVELRRVTDLLSQYDRRYVRRIKSFLPWTLVVLLVVALISRLGVF
jgi:hypothetical protein